jgi:protein SCO1/2
MKLLVVLALIGALAACSRQAPALDVFGDIPQFDLTAQDGHPFHSQALAGKIWVADFIYTTCPGPCPRMTSQMREVQDAILKIPQDVADVRLVSFTVDPSEDTPPVLAAYAKVHGALSSVWYFLTGPVSTLQMLDRNAFKLGDIDATLQHSTRFVLVDGQGRIRGYYDTSEASAIPKVISDINALARERT